MSLDVTPIGPIDPSAPAAAPRRRPLAQADSAPISAEIPPTPPDEVLDAIGAAAQRYDELRAQSRELRFEAGEDGLTIAVHDRDGEPLRTLKPSEALDVATGAPLD